MTNEPDWIEHDGSATCPVPAGHDVEIKRRDGGTVRRAYPPFNWADDIGQYSVTHYRDWTAFEQQAAGKDDVAGLFAALVATTEALERDGDPAFAHIIMDNRKIITAHKTAPVDPDVRLVADIINAFEDSHWVENDTVMHERHQASLKRAVEYYRTARTTNT